MSPSQKRRQKFERLAVPHLDALYGLALRLTSNERDAEDLVQDSMVKAFRFFHRFEEGSNIKAWLFKLMINLFYNNCRKNRNLTRLHLAAEIEPHYERFLSEATVNGQDAEKIIFDAIAVEQVRKEVDALPEEFRLAVLLSDLYGLSYKEISDVLNCPVGTVMSRLYRGRRLLQKQLIDYALEQGYVQARPLSLVEESNLTNLEAYRQQKGKR
jgi:RNA polymerase sigma-70 factor, ECF subfamily